MPEGNVSMHLKEIATDRKCLKHLEMEQQKVNAIDFRYIIIKIGKVLEVLNSKTFFVYCAVLSL